MSDCGAITNIFATHFYTKTLEDAVTVALHAGTDLECGLAYLFNLPTALNQSKINESDIDQALTRTFDVLVRLGWFDPPEQQIYRQLNKTHVDTPEARELSLTSAQESIVLLKNVNKSLPLKIDELIGKTIALIGPVADATVTMQGIYRGIAPFLIDPVTGFRNLTAGKSIDIVHARGCDISKSTGQEDFNRAVDLAKSSDVVIFLGGIDHTIEHEGIDREVIDLPDVQFKLLQALEQASRSPIHVVIMCGGGLDLSYVKNSTKSASLTWMGYPGQSGGLALATVMFGLYNPAGRLPITYYPGSYVDAVSMFDMQMRPSPTNPGRTYKFYTGQAVYEFGSGLSYTTFNYTSSNETIRSYSIDDLTKQNERSIIDSFRINVTNTGDMDGDDVVLAFVALPSIGDDEVTPFKQLFGFKRIHLAKNETQQVIFSFSIENALIVKHDGTKWFYPGLYSILIGTKHLFQLQFNGRPIRYI